MSSSQEHHHHQQKQQDESISTSAQTMSSHHTLQSWRSLLEISMAKTRKIRGSNYIQLATVDHATAASNINPEARVRTVVFRGMLSVPTEHILYNVCPHTDKDGNDQSLSCLLKMCTDRRSHKVQENTSVAEICWWFPKTSEQYRIRGSLILVGKEEEEADRTLSIARKELWGNLSDPARESFLNTHDVPGQPWTGDSTDNNSDTTIPKGGRDEEGKVVPPPDNFLLMLLNPHYCDYLCLSGDQYRQMDTRSSDDGAGGQWSSQQVNP
jgi:pyridoxamine 5'-phosphate oxidase